MNMGLRNGPGLLRQATQRTPSTTAEVVAALTASGRQALKLGSLKPGSLKFGSL